MAKGNKQQQQQQAGKAGGSKGPPQTQHKDLYQRYNFTLQASSFLHQLGLPARNANAIVAEGAVASTSTISPSVSTVFDRKGKMKAVDVPDDGGLDGHSRIFAQLARTGMKGAGTMVEHNQMKLDPSIKRNTCKVCSTVLIPGLTSRIRNRPNRSHLSVTHTTCLECLSSRTIPSPPVGTLEASKSLDGPVRARRRERIRKRSKISYHEQEQGQTESTSRDEHGTGRKADRKGHTLWREGETVSGWGGLAQQTSLEDSA